MTSAWFDKNGVRARFVAHTTHPDPSIFPVTTLEFYFPENDLSFFQQRCRHASLVHTVEHAVEDCVSGRYARREYRAVATGAAWQQFLGFFQNALALNRDRTYEYVTQAALGARPVVSRASRRGGWHLPFISSRECTFGAHMDTLPYLSVMRCIAPKEYPCDQDAHHFGKQLWEAHNLLRATSSPGLSSLHQMRPRRPGDPEVFPGAVPFGWIPFMTLLKKNCPEDEVGLLQTRVPVLGRDVSAIRALCQALGA